MRFCSSTSGLLKLVAETPRFRSSRINESTRDLRGQATKIIAWRGYEYPLKERYLQTAGNNWNIIHFACPVDKMVNTSFQLKAVNKAFFCCSVRLRKVLIKYRGQNFFEYSSGTTSMSKSRNMASLYVPWSPTKVIASAVYKQFPSLVERGEI